MNSFEIKGKVNTAICFAKVAEDEAIEQIRRMCDYSITEGSRIRIMPDVHSGMDVWGENGLVPDLIPYRERTVVFDITGLACHIELKNVERLPS